MRARWIVAAAVVPAVLAAAPSGASTKPPRITLTPDNVMVNAQVSVAGRHFPAHQKIRLRECGQTGWVVTQTKNECSPGHIKVRTDRHGRFTTTYAAQICPDSTPQNGPVTRRRCFIGEPMPSGVDTLTLVGHAKLIVTYP